MEVLTISLGRNILEKSSRERTRMLSYAQHLTELHIIVLTRKAHGYATDQHEGNLHIYPTHSHSRFMMLWDAFCIGRKIALRTRVEPLVISAQDPLEIGWLCWLLSFLKNTRLHIQVHGDYFSSNAWIGKSPLRLLRRAGALLLLKHTRAIRVVSKRIKSSLIARGVREDKITVLPIRPELEKFLATNHRAKQSPPYTFLYIGRLVSEKNIPRILCAFKKVLVEYPESQLRIVGDGSEKSHIIKRISELDIKREVSIVPWTENVPEEMERADIFLLASKHEAYALTLIEAMAVGLPIITTDVGCVGEMVIDGVHGIVVKDNSVESYAVAMKHMIAADSFRESCGEHGKETILTQMSEDADTYARAWVTSMNSALENV